MEDRQKPTPRELIGILDRLGQHGIREEMLSPFLCDEDGSEYAVWLVDTGGSKTVLKRAKGCEVEIYRRFFPEEKPYVPAFLGAAEYGGDTFFLTEYCPGTDLKVCTRGALQKALDALIAMQDEFWERADLYDAAVTLSKGLENVARRGQYLGSAQLEKAYAQFVRLYRTTPRTLCHDDLLPFNLLIGERAVLIDWEYGGMLPYPASLARLIAHGREEDGAYFYLTQADRSFAIDYYYENLVRPHGIAWEDYRQTLDHFLLFEYCEWIMVGNKYGSREDERYIRSRALAEELAAALLILEKRRTACEIRG